MVLLSLIVVASKIKDKVHSRWLANFIAFFGIVEPILFFTLLIGCAVIGEYIAAIICAVVITLHYIANFIMLLYFKKVTLNDLEFSKWSKVYRKSKIAIAVIGGVLSFRLFRLFYGGLFGLDIFMARFENPRKALIKIQRILALLSLTLVYIPLCIASIFVFINVSWGYQSLVTAIEAFILYAIFLALHILELKYDSSPMSDKEYLQIGLKKYGEDITMAGVPFNYNDNLREREEEKDYDTDKKAMYRLIQSVQEYNKYGFFSNENTNRFKVKKKMRRAFSDKNLAVIQEEENEDDQKTESRGESDEEEEDYMKPFAFMKHPRRPRRFSIGTEKHLEQYADKKFFSRIADIRSGKYLPNNVYAESQPPRQYSKTARLFNVDRVTQTDDNDLKLLWKLSRMIPPFKLADILGEFEMDSNGMFIIVRDEGKLKDKHGRLVNSRGYLVDEEGNVVHQNGTKIFNKDELDENNEIPAPFLLEENEFDILAQPGSLIHNEKKVGKPPKATVRKNFKKKFDDRKVSYSNKIPPTLL